jgi:hypothetical protein
MDKSAMTWVVCGMVKEDPIAFEAYETLAERFSALAESKAENAFIEQPAIRAVIGAVQRLAILDAGCGPGILGKYNQINGMKVYQCPR